MTDLPARLRSLATALFLQAKPPPGGCPQQALLLAAQARQQRLENELDRCNQALLDASIAAAEAACARRDLLRRMGHDLRAPLTTVMGYADLIGRSEGRGRHLVSGLQRNARQMLALIDGLMAASHGSVQAEPLRPQPLHLADFLAAVAARAAAAAEQNGNRFDYQAARELPDQVLADAKRLRQVLAHLLANAAAFTAGGDIGLRVDCLAGASAGQPLSMVFTIRDTGPGMAQAQVRTLCAPWQAPECSPQAAGGGLGLAVTRQWVERMGGCIEVVSGAGRGTLVRVMVPLMPPCEQARAARALASADDAAGPQAQASGLAQVQQEVARLQALLDVRAKALQAARLAAYEADRDRADLLGGIHSSLRLPVAPICGDARMLVRTVAGAAGHAQTILRSAIRLQGLVDDLIAYAQAGAPAPVPERCPTDLRAWLNGIAAEAQSRAAANGNRLNCAWAGELPAVVQMDRKRLRRVLLALLNHAATGLRNGQIEFAATVHAGAVPAAPVALTFTVRDMGSIDMDMDMDLGMAASRLEQIFTPFTRCAPDPAGPGADLAIARHRARLMNGELVAAREPGPGTTLTLVLPVEALVACPGQPPALPVQAAAPGRERQAAAGPMVLPEADLRAYLSGLVSMGAISDLIDWASSAEARNAVWHGFAQAVADRAGRGDLRGIAALLAEPGPEK